MDNRNNPIGENYGIDFNSVWPYIPMVAIYALLVIFTLGYAASVAFSGNDPSVYAVTPITAINLVSGTVLVLGLYLFLPALRTAWFKFWKFATDDDREYNGGKIKPEQISSGTLDLLPFVVLFIGWLIYGTFMASYPTFDGGPSQVICAVWLLWLCLLQVDNIRTLEHVRKCFTFLLYVAILFVPTRFGIASLTPWYVLLSKGTISYILFVLLSVEGETIWARPKVQRKKNTHYMNSVECRISHTAWILWCPIIFLFAAIPFIIISIYRIYLNTRSIIKKEPSVRKKPGKRREKPPRKHIGDPPEKTMITDDETSYVQISESEERDIELGTQKQLDYAAMELGVVYNHNGISYVYTDRGLTKIIPNQVYVLDGGYYKLIDGEYVPVTGTQLAIRG